MGFLKNYYVHTRPWWYIPKNPRGSRAGDKVLSRKNDLLINFPYIRHRWAWIVIKIWLKADFLIKKRQKEKREKKQKCGAETLKSSRHPDDAVDPQKCGDYYGLNFFICFGNLSFSLTCLLVQRMFTTSSVISSRPAPPVYWSICPRLCCPPWRTTGLKLWLIKINHLAHSCR